jgi:hypothetical protein
VKPAAVERKKTAAEKRAEAKAAQEKAAKPDAETPCAPKEPAQDDGRDGQQERVARRRGAVELPEEPCADRRSRSRDPGHEGGGMNVGTVHATTVVSVRHRGRVAIAGDGQVSLGNTVIKPNAKKVRRIGDGPRRGLGAVDRSGAMSRESHSGGDEPLNADGGDEERVSSSHRQVRAR